MEEKKERKKMKEKKRGKLEQVNHLIPIPQNTAGIVGLAHGLEQRAFSLLLLHRGWTENSSNRLVKHCLKATLRQGRAFQIFHSS